MTNAEIQILFPQPGEWEKMILTAIFPDADGFIQSRRYTQDEIPDNLTPALAAAVGAIASMGEDWQASQVWARLLRVAAGASDPSSAEAIVLTVEAVNTAGGRRTFTAADYPEFILLDSEALDFFNYFTTNNK